MQWGGYVVLAIYSIIWALFDIYTLWINPASSEGVAMLLGIPLLLLFLLLQILWAVVGWQLEVSLRKA